MKTRKCPNCKKEKQLTVKFWKRSNASSFGFMYECRDCCNERRRKARAEKKGYYATERQRNYKQHLNACRNLYHRYKQQVFEHYCNGNPKCVKCGFEDVRALSVDHVNGGGGKHRKELNGVNLVKWLVKNNFPAEFQILCMNCQFIKRHEQTGYEKWRDDPDWKCWDRNS